MLTDKEKEYRKELRHEIRARELVIKKVENAHSRLKKQAENKFNERKKRVEEISIYESERDLLDAYGWGLITEEEYDKIRILREKGEDSLLNDKSAEEYAAKILGEFIIHLKHEISSLKFELLPEKEQNRIREQNYEIAMKRAARRNAECKGVK